MTRRPNLPSPADFPATARMVIGLGLVVLSSPAQDALQANLEGERWLATRRQMIENHPYNLRLGDLRLLVEAGLELRYEDNVDLSEDNPEDDFVIRPSARLFSMLPVSTRNSVTFDVGVSYQGYLDHPDLNRIVIEPGSYVGFDLFIDQTRVNLHNRFSYVDDPLETGPVSGESRFGGLYNTSGISVHWPLNELVFEAGYDFNVFQSSVSQYSYLDRFNHGFFARALAELRDDLATGLEFSAGLARYDQALLNDNANVSFGPFIEWQITRYLRWVARGGYVVYTFEPTGVVPPQDDVNSFYASTSFDHRLSERVSQVFYFSRSFEQGVNSEVLDRWFVQHGINWNFIQRTGLNTSIFYENGKEDGYASAEEYSRVGLGIRLSRSLGEHLSGLLFYELVVKDSKLPARDYTANRVGAQLVWRF